MNVSDLLTQARLTLARLETAVNCPDPRDGMNVPARIRESFQGWPSGGGYDRTSRRATDRDGEPLPMHSDPTGDAGTRPDKARDDLRLMEKDARAIVNALERITVIASHWQLRDANMIERQNTEEIESPSCDSCARVKGLHSERHWSPLYRAATLANGVRVNLCASCYSGPSGVLETGQYPPKEAVEARRDGKRWRGKAA